MSFAKTSSDVLLLSSATIEFVVHGKRHVDDAHGRGAEGNLILPQGGGLTVEQRAQLRQLVCPVRS